MAPSSRRTPSDVNEQILYSDTTRPDDPPAPLSPFGSQSPVTPSHPDQLPPLKGVAKRLFTEGFVFDFFQAIRVLERLQPNQFGLTRISSPEKEIVRLRTRLSFDFPPSPIYEVLPPHADFPLPTMVVAFMGLTGPSGVLPRIYTELLYRIQRESKHEEKWALRDWLDLFNHRMISLFYRAWEKYRFYIPYERGEFDQPDPDPFTQVVYSFVGMGTPALRNRLRISHRKSTLQKEQVLAKIDDLGLLRFSGFFSQQPRCAVSLQMLLSTYFKVPVQVLQFQGQWLRLDPANQSSLGRLGTNNAMGQDARIGDRIWDTQSKIRIRLGPLTYEQFLQFLPDTSPVPERKVLFLLSHLVRLYVRMEIDVEVQLVLRADEVPKCQMGKGKGTLGSRIGWNTWSRKKQMSRHADEPVFQTQEIVYLPPAPTFVG